MKKKDGIYILVKNTTTIKTFTTKMWTTLLHKINFRNFRHRLVKGVKFFYDPNETVSSCTANVIEKKLRH